MADLFSQAKEQPLAERMRPQSLAEVAGQEHLVGEGKPLTELAQQDNLPSMILWGPPGTGKTTIARALAGEREFHQISAVLSGVKELRRVVDSVRARGGGMVLFVDEIHRWNKAQQDGLLPYVEDGTITLIGATTENPSFSLIAPLMSRCKLFVLRPLDDAQVKKILQRALRDADRGLGQKRIVIDDDAWDALLAVADGDARRGLNTLEILAGLANNITEKLVRTVYEKRSHRYDRDGDQHYDIISAFIKSMRGSDPDAAVYYLSRMYESGEDPRFLARRMIIFASEDVGNADPRALQIALNAAEAFERVGQAEGWIPLSHAATYLAAAPKSNASYMAYKLAKADVSAKGDLEVPLYLRNAATKLMKGLGYGKEYEYAHDQENQLVSHHHLPAELQGKTYYHPTEHGYEKALKERVDWYRAKRKSAKPKQSEKKD